MGLPHTSVDKLHEAAVEACMAYERACRRRGMKLNKLTITYEPAGEGFDMQFDEKPYPRTKAGNALIPVEDEYSADEDVPMPFVKDG